MQRKMILEEPPKPRCSNKEHAVAAVRTLRGEATLIVWVYKAGRSKEPAITIGETQKDYGVYEKGAWHQYNVAMKMSVNDIDICKEDYDTIRDFFKGAKPVNNPLYRDHAWVEWVDIARKRMLDNKRYEVAERRHKALQERRECLYEIPKEMINWAKQELASKHTLTYHKKGRMATVQCSCCGKTAQYTFEPVTLEDMARQGEKPYHNEPGVCTLCGAEGIYKAAGYYKGVYTQTKQVYMLQGTKDPGKIVARFVEVGVVRTAEYERIYEAEIARAFIQEGRKNVQYDYQKYNPYLGEWYWDDCNYGMYAGEKPVRLEGKMWPGSYAELANTRMKYSGVEWYKMHVNFANVIGYLQIYNINPVVEILTKMGLEKLVHHFAYGGWRSMLENKSAKTVCDLLGINKQQLRTLRKYHGDIDMLRVMRYEKSHGLQWNEDMEVWLAKCALYEDAYESILSCMSMTKFRNYAEKVAAQAKVDINRVIRTYADYLDMRAKLGYDMTNTVYLFPHDMYAGHAQMVKEQNKKEQDIWKAENEKAFSSIRNNFKKLDKRYHYESGAYMIRPCKSASEIIDEGRLQHHCVGGESYLRKHNIGKSYILVLRKKDVPDMPFVTVEISTKFSVMQWYGPHDTKNNDEIGLNEKQIDEWLEQYTNAKQRKLRPAMADTGAMADAGAMAPAV